jgi:hypothetical protein
VAAVLVEVVTVVAVATTNLWVCNDFSRYENALKMSEDSQQMLKVRQN